jgi:hypothetical protein
VQIVAHFRYFAIGRTARVHAIDQVREIPVLAGGRHGRRQAVNHEHGKIRVPPLLAQADVGHRLHVGVGNGSKRSQKVLAGLRLGKAVRLLLFNIESVRTRLISAYFAVNLMRCKLQNDLILF